MNQLFKTLLIPPLLINRKFITDIKNKSKDISQILFNVQLIEQLIEECSLLKNESALSTNQHVLTQSRLHSIDSSFEEISKTKRSLDVNKARGHDDISMRIIKICGNSLVRPFSLLFKKSFVNSYFPDSWKKLSVIPVHKK